MSSAAIETQTNIFDGSNLAALKRLTKQNDPAAIKSAAQQFEALFVQMMLKSMRDATPRDEAMGSDQQRMYESLLDQQLSQVMATRGNGTGLAAMIEKQMTQKQPDLDQPGKGLPGLPGLPLAPAEKSFALPSERQFALPVGQ
jgi:flagellar protein FlgJ